MRRDVPKCMASEWNQAIISGARSGEAWAGVHERHPRWRFVGWRGFGPLTGTAFWYKPFRLFGLDHIYLAPGSEKAYRRASRSGRYSRVHPPVDCGGNALKKERSWLRCAGARPLRQHHATLRLAAAREQPATACRCGQPSDVLSAGEGWYRERWRVIGGCRVVATCAVVANANGRSLLRANVRTSIWAAVRYRDGCR